MSSSYSTYNIRFYSNDTIEKLAEELLTYTGFLNKGSIDIVQLAKELGLNVFTADLGGRDGYIKFSYGERSIYVSNAVSKTRKRFTIAHELAHYLLHRNILEQAGGSVLYRGEEGDYAESQANQCAAALLMPKSLVEKYYNELNVANSVKTTILANIFDVSVEAMYIRLQTLGLVG